VERVDNGYDCDDGDAAVSPSAVEVCDGVDDDCDGAVDEGLLVAALVDVDGDGAAGQLMPSCVAGLVTVTEDCNEGDPTVFLGAPEICGNEGDDDCDLVVDEGCPIDEVCDNGVDDDADGLTDCEDADCAALCVEDCEALGDEDGDRVEGCDDDDCAYTPECSGAWTLSLAGGTATVRRDAYEGYWSDRSETSVRWTLEQARGTLSVDGAVCSWWVQGGWFATGQVTTGVWSDSPSTTPFTQSDARFFFDASCPIDPADMPVLPVQSGPVGASLWGAPWLSGPQVPESGGGWSADEGSGNHTVRTVPQLESAGPIEIPSSAW
jgi:hypothetical protein